MFLRRFSKTAGAMLAATVVATALIGCSDDDNDGPAGGGCDISRWSGGLVLPSGCAWTDAHRYSVGNRDGLIFNANGTGYWISDYDDTWTIEEQGTYTVSGNRVTATYDGGMEISSTYSIVGNKLTLPNLSAMWMGTEYVITSNVTIGSSSGNSAVVNVGGNNNGGDNRPELAGGNITNGARDAWVMCDDDFYDYGEEGCMGYAFRNGKVFNSMEMEEFGVWIQFETGTYSTSGNTITMNMNPDLMDDDEPTTATGTYGVSGNELTLDFFGERMTFTKQTGLTFVDVDDPNNMEGLVIVGLCIGLVEEEFYNSISECIADDASLFLDLVCMGMPIEYCLDMIMGDDFAKRSEIRVDRIDVPSQLSRIRLPASQPRTTKPLRR